MKTIALIGCAKNKLNTKSKSKDIYTGDLFKKSKTHVEKHHDGFFILSALHGLLEPEKEIEPYDYTLNDLTKKQIEEWSESVHKQLLSAIKEGENVELFIYAGDKYRKFLLPLLEKSGFKVSVPLKGLGIGQQLAWFKDNIGE
nr:DUF6884 domain-containing protein [Paenibacillus xylanexedens]